MRPFFPLSVLCLAAGLVSACKPEEVIQTEDIPTAGIRFINAVPDTGAMDFRAVDIVENSASYNVAFRSTTLLYYKPARAGTRNFKIFRTPTATDPSATQIATAQTVVFDLAGEVLEAGKRYTYILWGYSRPGSTPAMQITRLTDDPTDPGAQVALRIINACVPGLCGASADGAVDVRVFTAAQTIAAPATTFPAVAALTASAYQNVATTTGCGTTSSTLPNCYTFDFRPVGGATAGAALASGAGPAGILEAVDLDAVPGTNVAGSAVSAILFPRSLAGTQAVSFTTPGIIFVWDKRPPRTCALC
ncbi:MAG TPA: DUF4397 domain-containing protein [Gemmatimonadales bacterium]|jgi:hypothetical protein|nr:DUF4397 domain-containing protein [Gemmatimonadales bacterium]